MAFPWGLALFLVGLAYGFFTPGRQDKGRLLRNGLLIGLALAILFALLGAFAHVNPVGLGTTALDTFLSVVILTLLFILGAWLGDLIEGVRSKPRRQNP